VKFETKLATVSLIMSIVAIGFTCIQTFIQWNERITPYRSNLYSLQLASCTELIIELVRFSNTNAEIRLILGSQRGNQGAENTKLFNKQDLEISTLGNSDRQKYLTEQLTQKTTKQNDIASKINEIIVSRHHLYDKKTRENLGYLSDMLLPLITEPEGTQGVNSSDFVAGLEKFRSECRAISDNLLGSTDQ
jgi:hypothetical protein